MPVAARNPYAYPMTLADVASAILRLAEEQSKPGGALAMLAAYPGGGAAGRAAKKVEAATAERVLPKLLAGLREDVDPKSAVEAASRIESAAGPYVRALLPRPIKGFSRGGEKPLSLEDLSQAAYAAVKKARVFEKPAPQVPDVHPAAAAVSGPARKAMRNLVSSFREPVNRPFKDEALIREVEELKKRLGYAPDIGDVVAFRKERGATKASNLGKKRTRAVLEDLKSGKKKAKRVEITPELERTTPSSEPSPETFAASREDQNAIRQAVMALPARQKAVMGMRTGLVGERLTIPQIAKILGTSERTVNNEILRAQKTLRKTLPEHLVPATPPAKVLAKPQPPAGTTPEYLGSWPKSWGKGPTSKSSYEWKAPTSVGASRQSPISREEAARAFQKPSEVRRGFPDPYPDPVSFIPRLLPPSPPISGGAGPVSRDDLLRQVRERMVKMLGGKYPPKEPDPEIVRQFSRGSNADFLHGSAIANVSEGGQIPGMPLLRGHRALWQPTRGGNWFLDTEWGSPVGRPIMEIKE